METYMTSDLYLSAFLKAKGFKLINTKRDGKKVIFIFEDKKDRNELIRKFFDNGLVNVRDFRSAIQDLKTIVFNT